MIIKLPSKCYRDGDMRREIKYAWLPTRMREFKHDHSGAIIWLEQYEETTTCRVTSYDQSWELNQRRRVSDLVLEKLSEYRD